MQFTHLYVETNHSLRGSNITIESLIEKAKEFAFSSLAITDTRMYGVIKFYKACIKNAIKPIIGFAIELEGVNSEKRNKVLLYALNNEGYQNILKIASILANNTFLKQSEMKELKDGIIAIYHSKDSELMAYYQNNQKNEFIEVINSLNDTFNEYLISVSKNHDYNVFFEEKKKLVYADKVEYLEENDKDVSDVLKKIYGIVTDDLFETEDNCHLSNPDTKELVYENALNNIGFITDKCNVEITFDQTHLPSYPNNKNVSSKEYLRALVFKGLEKRIQGLKLDKKTYIERAEYELGVIDSMGYNDYFLIVWDFVKYAKKKKYLVGPGRGSAAASLVSYCLGITSVDSIKYDLVFERFLNPERISLPDIDMDLPDDKRDDIIMYVRDLYGKDKVASICTFGTFLSKSAIRDTARVLKVEGLIIEEIIKHADTYKTIKIMMEESKEIQNIMEKSKEANALIKIASRIEGLNKHVSTHAAGIIVSAEKLTNHSAVQPGLLQMNQTQFEMKDLESLGLLKIDFLGLRNLTSIDKIVRLINEKENTNIDIYKVPLDDKLTYDLLKRVDTTGIFQLESQGMRSLIGQMQMYQFEDIVTVLALFRPGPMENIPAYIKRRNKVESVSFPHPILKEVLESTNGIIIYQEQIIKIASLFAGYSLGEADLLRRAVSKKQQRVLEEERKHFVDMSTKQGHKTETSNEIYDYIVKFANYGFNRAHSVAYAMVSYWMAYLKANYPKYFISVLTSSVIGSEKQMRSYIFEANKLGVKILPPSVNKSTAIFEPEEDNLRFPLLGIKNLGGTVVKALLTEREEGEFTSFVDFISRTHNVLNKRVLESLIKASALDEFGYSKKTMINKYEEVINYNLFGNFIDNNQFVLVNEEEYGYTELEAMEFSVLGFNLMMNPINEHDEYIKKHKLLTPSTITTKHVGTQVRLVGLVTFVKKIKTKAGKDMAFVTIQDGFTKMDGVLFTSTYEEFKDMIEKNNVYLFKVKVEERNGNLQLVINNVHKL